MDYYSLTYPSPPQVRSTDYTWKEAKKSLKKDSRWESASALEREEREALFNLHVETLTKRKREKFRSGFVVAGIASISSSIIMILVTARDALRTYRYTLGGKCHRLIIYRTSVGKHIPSFFVCLDCITST